MAYSVKKLVLAIIACFCMFLPRRVEILNIYSYRVFIILGAFIGFSLVRYKIRLFSPITSLAYLLYISFYCLRYIAESEIVGMLGFVVETLVLMALFGTMLESKRDLDYWITLFMRALLVYCFLCLVETFTGFSIWSLFGASKTFMRYGLYRSYGAFSTSINNGVFLMLCFPIVYYYKVHICDDTFCKIVHVFVWPALCSTLSRAPLLAALLLNIIWVWKNGLAKFLRQHALHLLLSIGILIVLCNYGPLKSIFQSYINMFVAIINPEVAQSIGTSFGSNANGVGHRFSLVSWVFDALNKEHAFIFGVGPVKEFNYAFVTSQGSTHFKQSIENHYLSQLYRYGIVGLALHSAFLIRCLFSTKKGINLELRNHEKLCVSNTFQFRLLSTFFCYYLVLFTVGAVDDYRMFLLLVVISEIWKKVDCAVPECVHCRNQRLE